MQEIKITISPDYVVTIHQSGEGNGKEEAKLLRAANRVKASLKELRYTLTHLKAALTDNEKSRYRMRFLNIKALELLLRHDLSLWTNCRDDESLLRQLADHDFAPELDAWEAEWMVFLDYCQMTQSKRIQQWDEQRRRAQKQLHLINIKQRRLGALVDTIQFNAGFVAKVYNNFTISHKTHKLNQGCFVVRLYVGDEAELRIELKLDMIDACTVRVVEALRQLNTLIPKLNETLAHDKEQYGVTLYVFGTPYRTNRLYLSDELMGIEKIEDERFASCKIINEMNNIIRMTIKTD